VIPRLHGSWAVSQLAHDSPAQPPLIDPRARGKLMVGVVARPESGQPYAVRGRQPVQSLRVKAAPSRAVQLLQGLVTSGSNASKRSGPHPQPGLPRRSRPGRRTKSRSLSPGQAVHLVRPELGAHLRLGPSLAELSPGGGVSQPRRCRRAGGAQDWPAHAAPAVLRNG